MFSFPVLSISENSLYLYSSSTCFKYLLENVVFLIVWPGVWQQQRIWSSVPPLAQNSTPCNNLKFIWLVFFSSWTHFRIVCDVFALVDQEAIRTCSQWISIAFSTWLQMLSEYFLFASFLWSRTRSTQKQRKSLSNVILLRNFLYSLLGSYLLF